MTQPTAVKLIAWHANGSIQSCALEANQAVLVGKSSNCGILLSGHDIADIHCRIGFEDGHLWVQDWMSATGTKVNGTPVTSKTQVGQGSVVEVGNYKIQLSRAGKSGVEQENQLVDDQRVAALQADTQSSHPACDRLKTAVSCQIMDEQPTPARQDTEVKPDQMEDRCQAPGSMECEDDFFSDDNELYDRETVELLQAEIEDLRTALAQRDADTSSNAEVPPQTSAVAEDSEKMLHRIQELVEEANQADERVLILEEMLQAAEDANRAEVEERAHLEAWVGDIEKRIGQREQEHAAELDALRERLDSAGEQQSRLQRQLHQAATSGNTVNQQFEETLEELQRDKSQLQDALDETKKELRQLQQQYENQAEQTEVALREERVKIAREHAEMSRLKFEYAQKIKDLEETVPKSDSEIDPRLQSLREHRHYLREMSDLKKQEQQQSTLSNRLKRLWHRVE